MRTRVVLMLMSLAFTACGKKGALIYPEMLVPAAPSAVVAQQSGNSLKLSFVLPSKDRAGQNRAAPSGVTILRRDEAAGQNPGCSACTEDFSSFRNFTLDLLPDGIQRNGNRVVLIDGDVSSGRKYSYRVNTVTKDDLAGAPSLSNTAVMLPPPLPPLLQAISQPTEVSLEFFGQLPLEGTIAGYNLYRTVKGARFSFWPLNRELLTDHTYTDTGLERRRVYVYAVRTVIRLPSGVLVESGQSNEVEAILKDDE